MNRVVTVTTDEEWDAAIAAHKRDGWRLSAFSFFGGGPARLTFTRTALDPIPSSKNREGA